MKKNVSAVIAAFVCAISLCSCGNDPVSSSTKETTQIPDNIKEPIVIHTEDTTLDEYGLPEIRGVRVPEGASLKKTSVHLCNDSVTGEDVSFLNSNGDVILKYTVNTETGQATETMKCSYEYDSEGRLVHQIVDTHNSSETFYEYDEEGRLLVQTDYKNGKKWLVIENKYDEAGNKKSIHSITYDVYAETDGEPPVESETTEDYTDCDYDEQGRMIAYRYKLESGELSYTIIYKYDDKDNLISTEKDYADYGKAGYTGEYAIITSYQYDTVGNKTFEEIAHYTTPDEISSKTTNKWNYDGNGNVTYFETSQTNGKATIEKNTYEAVQ